MKHIIPFAEYGMIRRRVSTYDIRCDACEEKIKQNELYFWGRTKDFEKNNPGMSLSEFHYCYTCFDTLGHYVD